MTFELFKAFSPDQDGPVVELNVRDGSEVEIPAEVSRQDGQLRITIFARKDGIAWNYGLNEWMDAIQRAVEILED